MVRGREREGGREKSHKEQRRNSGKRSMKENHALEYQKSK